jgi:hypothetical protein
MSAPSPSSPAARATLGARHRDPSPIDGIVVGAKEIYNNETKGRKLHYELGRIAGDGILLDALRRGDFAGAQAEAQAQLASAINHTAHVTRIAVARGSRVVVDAIENSDGVYVVAPGSYVLRRNGRVLGTLLVSIQDVKGYVKLVHNVTSADCVVRGWHGHVRTSLGAALLVRLPMSGHVTIAGRGYLVRSFREIGWGNEPLTVWILLRG